MKLLVATVFLLNFLETISDPIRTVQIVEEPSERFADSEIPIRVIEIEEETLQLLEDDPYRLPTSVVPRNYTIQLVLNENFGPNGVFSGSVQIALEVLEAVEKITLHAQDLTINLGNIILMCGEDSTNLFSSLSNDITYHKITITSSRQIVAGSSCTLQINNYQGILDDDMRGLYRSSYTNKNGETE